MIPILKYSLFFRILLTIKIKNDKIIAAEAKNIKESLFGEIFTMKIIHDVHNHSLLSACCYDPVATVENFVNKSRELGHKVFGISNHLWDERVPGASSWYQKQMINYGLEARNSIPKDTGDVKVLIGTESEYLGATDTLGILAETGARFDYVLIPHTHTHMKNFVINEMPEVKEYRKLLKEKVSSAFPELNEQLAKKMVNAIGNNDIEVLCGISTESIYKYHADFMITSFHQLMNNPEFIKLAKTVPTSVAHPFHPCGFNGEARCAIQNMVSDEDYISCLEEAKKLGVYIEVNTGAVTQTADNYANDGAIRIFKLAKQVGCQFTFGTDSHSLAGLNAIRKGDDISEICGITESDLAEYVR